MGWLVAVFLALLLAIQFLSRRENAGGPEPPVVSETPPDVSETPSAVSEPSASSEFLEPAKRLEQAQRRPEIPKSRTDEDRYSEPTRAEPVDDGSWATVATVDSIDDRRSEPKAREPKAEDPELIRSFIQGLRDSSPNVRRSAAIALARNSSTDPMLLDALISASRDEDVGVRLKVYEAISRFRNTRAVESLIAGLKHEDRLQRSEDETFGRPWHVLEVVETIGKSLSKIGPPAVQPLLTFVDSRGIEPFTRKTAVLALGRMDDPRSLEALSNLLEHSEAKNRQFAAAALGNRILRDGDGTTELLVDALRDPSAEVRQQAAMSLGWLRAEKAVPALQIAARDSNEKVRQSALQALSRMGRMADETSGSPQAKEIR